MSNTDASCNETGGETGAETANDIFDEIVDVKKEEFLKNWRNIIGDLKSEFSAIIDFIDLNSQALIEIILTDIRDENKKRDILSFFELVRDTRKKCLSLRGFLDLYTKNNENRNKRNNEILKLALKRFLDAAKTNIKH